jgi:hypothetical protein
VEAGDRARLDDLFDYAGRQQAYYYDLCAFREPGAGEEFLAGERAFYAAPALAGRTGPCDR